MSKTAIILFNLGGPDSKDSIRPFLVNFFTDKNIIPLPYPIRWIIAQLIASRRSKREAGVSYRELGDKSPLFANTWEQGYALEAALNTGAEREYKVFVCMRYWNPMALAVAQQVKSWEPDNAVLLPLYPQFSTTTTRSSYQAWNAACKKTALDKPTKLICCYPTENGFIRANAANVKAAYEKAALETGLRPRILFSAHGLPEDIIKGGDPYQWQCEQAAETIVKASGLDNPDWQMCFQSRVGPKKWLSPSTEEALHLAAEDGVPVVILPHAFTQEHVETLVEIEIDYRDTAERLGVPGFYRVPTVGTHPDFIRGLADMVLSAPQSPKVASYVGSQICPANFSQCAMKSFCPSSGRC